MNARVCGSFDPRRSMEVEIKEHEGKPKTKRKPKPKQDKPKEAAHWLKGFEIKEH